MLVIFNLEGIVSGIYVVEMIGVGGMEWKLLFVWQICKRYREYQWENDM